MLGPKVPKVRSKPYRMYVASLPCYRCGIQGYSQAAHADEGKGMALKTDDLTCYPLCAPHPNGEDMKIVIGCHEIVGRQMSKEDRRAFEKLAAAWTTHTLIRQSQDDRNLSELLLKLGML